MPFAPFLIPITRPGSSAALSTQGPYLVVVLQTEHPPLVRTPAAQNGTAAGLWKLARVSAVATSSNRSLNVLILPLAGSALAPMGSLQPRRLPQGCIVPDMFRLCPEIAVNVA